MSVDVIRLDRIGNTPWGAFGFLRLPDGSSFPTVEPPWRHNARGESCIPAGSYAMAKRVSPMVRRTSGGEFHSGWEVQGVPGRDLIMIHPGNWATDSDGCILVGRLHQVINGVPGVSASRAAFQDLMRRLDKRETWGISIRWQNPEGA